MGARGDPPELSERKLSDENARRNLSRKSEPLLNPSESELEEKRTMADPSSIELAAFLGAGLAWLRLFSIGQVARALPRQSEAVRSAAASGDDAALRRQIRRFGKLYPMASIGPDLLFALDSTPDERHTHFTRIEVFTRRRALEKTQRAQGLDLVALALLFGLSLYAAQSLKAGCALWMGLGALGLAIAGDVLFRIHLLSRAERSVHQVVESLRAVPTQP